MLTDAVLTQFGDCFTLTVPLMRSNSVMRDTSWVARIVGTCPKYRFTREFVRRNAKQSTSDGEQMFLDLHSHEIYEFRNIAYKGQSGYSYVKHGGESGFFEIVGNQILILQDADVSNRIAISGAASLTGISAQTGE